MADGWGGEMDVMEKEGRKHNGRMLSQRGGHYKLQCQHMQTSPHSQVLSNWPGNEANTHMLFKSGAGYIKLCFVKKHHEEFKLPGVLPLSYKQPPDNHQMTPRRPPDDPQTTTRRPPALIIPLCILQQSLLPAEARSL